MKKQMRILWSLLIFLIIAAFVGYMIRSLHQDDAAIMNTSATENTTFISPYQQIYCFEFSQPIQSFDLYQHKLYVSAADSVFCMDLSGRCLFAFPTGGEVRDIAVKDDQVYLLYPTKIEVYTLSGKKLRNWEACSENADYCSLSLSADFVFVTDAENKNIAKYTRQGEFRTFIKSPQGFVIPSYSFPILLINDILYTGNSGRHILESFTLDGSFIRSFGKVGEQAGAFAGCCNPIYLALSTQGDILTSEKGNPRISCYSRDGKFRGILLNSELLGGGTGAYRVKAADQYLVTSGKNKLTVFKFDPALAVKSACRGCTVDCPLRKPVVN